MKTLAEFISKDTNHMDGSTIYWFKLSGNNFNNEVFGIVYYGMIHSVVEYDGYPVDSNELRFQRIIDACFIAPLMESK